ncbi:MAG: glycosyltransferase family 39 protein, partial [Anaerolineae bacterium]|nr:glycosyltransferase family 39 protein [Anaerolineae bacterium]
MKNHRFLLLIVFLLAAALRVVNLENVPPPFNVDEAANGYDAYSVLKTGRDQWGNILPVTFRAFNDFRRPATIYSAIPFIAIYNLTIYGIRAMAAFWGWWSVVFLYRLVCDMTNQRTALFSALLLTLSPWHIAFSRLGVEVSGPLITSIIAAIDFTWRWSQSGKDRWIYAAAVAFAISIYAYTVAQAFTPLMLAVLFLIYITRFKHRWKTGLVAILIFCLLISPLLVNLFSNPLTWNRYDRISVLKPPYGDSVPIVIAQWIGHFTPGYLFIKGDANPIHHPPGFGQLLWIQALLIPIGTLRLLLAFFPKPWSSREKILWKRQPFLILILVSWLILGALPAAMTRQDMESANAMRGILTLPAWTILSAIGLESVAYSAKTLKRKRILWLTALVLTSINSVIVLRNYFRIYPVTAARAFEYGIQASLSYVVENEANYTKIVLTDWISQPHIFAVFYSRYDPVAFQRNHAGYSSALSAKLSEWGEKYETGDVEKLYET